MRDRQVISQNKLGWKLDEGKVWWFAQAATVTLAMTKMGNENKHLQMREMN